MEGAVEKHFGACSDVEAGLDDAVVAQRDAAAGIGAEQAALAQRDDVLAAAGQGAHDRCAATDIGAVINGDASGNAALNHGSAERASVEVHEALMHHGGAICQVRAKSDAVGVTDAHARGNHIVDHAWELVDAINRNLASA